VQRAERPSGRDCGVRRFRLVIRPLLVDTHESAEPGVQVSNLAEVRISNFARRKLVIANSSGYLPRWNTYVRTVHGLAV
jgi:hypothetical protein